MKKVIIAGIVLAMFAGAANAHVKKGHGQKQAFVPANLDMIQHYRPRENVLLRPTQTSGQALPLTGQHEILVPLLHALLTGE